MIQESKKEVTVKHKTTIIERPLQRGDVVTTEDGCVVLMLDIPGGSCDFEGVCLNPGTKYDGDMRIWNMDAFDYFRGEIIIKQ